MRIYLLVLSVIIFFAQPLYSVTKGSETAVSVEPSYTFTGTGNEMLGFGWFKNGFNLQDSSTTCSFNNVFPVSGSVNLNGGTLYLAQDLLFRNVTDLLGMGNIYGYDHLLDLCSSITSIPADAEEFSDITISFNNSITLNSQITFKGFCSIDGKNNSLNLGDGAIVVDSGATLELKNLWLNDITGTNVRCVDDTAQIILKDVKWVQGGDVAFEHGGILFENFVDFCGSFTFSYDSACTSTIDSCSRWTLSEGMNLSIANNGRQPLHFMNGQSSALRFDGSSWYVRSPGMLIDQGFLEFSRDVTLDIASSSTADGLILGDGDSEKDVCFELLPGAVVTCPRGHLVYDVASDNWIVSESLTSRLIRGAESTFYVKQDLTFPNITITADPSSTLNVMEGKVITWDNVVFLQSSGEFQTQSQRYAANRYLLDDNDSIFLKRGSFAGDILVSGVDNKVQGGGILNGAIQLLDEAAALSLDFNGILNYSLALNGGELTLLQDCKMMNEASVTGNGIINLGTATMVGGYSYLVDWLGTYTWQSTSGGISLNSSVAIDGSWIIDGNCFIDGNSRTIDLTNGEIIVTEGSLLTLQNASIKGLADQNIRCMNNDSHIIFHDTTLQLDNDFTFSIGELTASLNVDIIGTSTFYYCSQNSFNISSNSTLKLSDCICQLGPCEDSPHMNWFSFVDHTSNLILDNCDFNVSSDGIFVSKGIIGVSRDVVLDIDSTSTSNGIIMGSGTEADDMALEFGAGSSLDVTRGHITYNVTSGNGIRARSKYTRLRRHADTTFYVRQDLTFKDIVLDDDPNCISLSDPGVMVRYDYCTQRVSDGIHQSKFRSSSYVYDAVDQLLAGNQSIWLETCGLPIKTYVTGTGNRIMGQGNIHKLITLLDSSAEIILGINGYLSGGIDLNGGTLTLENSLSGLSTCGPGIIDLSHYNLELAHSSLDWNSEILWIGDNGALTLNSDVTLSSTWTFSGTCEINGNGNQLDLTDGSIVIESNSHVSFKNINLVGIAEGSIICDDETSILELNEVNWFQDGSYTFTNGSFIIKETVKMKGPEIFEYYSSQASTISHDSRLKLDKGIVFDYKPTNTRTDLLVFEDESATLELSGATLNTAYQGLELTRGKLFIKEHSSLTSTSTVDDEYDEPVTIDEGIIFGDGLSEHDFTCEISSGVELEVNGTLKNRNVNSSSWIVPTPTSRLYIADNSNLYIYNNLDLGEGIVVFGENTHLYRLSDTSILSTVSVAGSFNYSYL